MNITKSVVIGFDSKTGQPITIDQEARARSTYVIGITGVGKSSLLERIAYQDMLNGDGLLFLDPHGDSAESLLASVPSNRVDDVVFWDPFDLDHPLGLNPFYVPQPQDRLAVTRKADNFVAALGSLREFAPVFESAPQMKNILHNLAMAFVANQGHSLLETPEFLANGQFRREFYPQLLPRHKGVREYWERFDGLRESIQFDMVRSTLNKLERIPTNPVMEEIFSRETSIDFRGAMDDGKIIIQKLTGAGIEDTAAFVGTFTLWEVLEAGRSRIDVAPHARRPFHVFADEIQTYATTAIPIIIEQSRKFGLDLTVAHQIREQLDRDLRERVRGVANLIVYRVTRPNAEALAGEFRITIPEPAVPRFEQKYELVRDVLGHLETKGHEDNFVMGMYRELRTGLDSVIEQALRELKSKSITVRGHPEITSADYKIVEMKSKHLESAINQFLHSSMTLPKSLDHEGVIAARQEKGFPASLGDCGCMFDEFYADIFTCVGRTNGVRSALAEYFRLTCEFPNEAFDLKINTMVLPNTFATFQEMVCKFLPVLRKRGTHVSQLLGSLAYLPDYRQGFENWPHAYRLVKLESAVWKSMDLLSHAVYAHRCYAQVGQLNPIPEPRRLYSDVELEVANRLTNLERFHAFCKLEVGTKVENSEIVGLNGLGHRQSMVTQEVKQRSWEKYVSPVIFRVPSDRIPYSNETDDEETIFGEKRAASNT